jgi:hypothetical protein
MDDHAADAARYMAQGIGGPPAPWHPDRWTGIPDTALAHQYTEELASDDCPWEMLFAALDEIDRLRAAIKPATDALRSARTRATRSNIIGRHNAVLEAVAAIVDTEDAQEATDADRG